eukprot:4142449-Amphidinium_carterae.1
MEPRASSAKVLDARQPHFQLHHLPSSEPEQLLIDNLRLTGNDNYEGSEDMIHSPHDGKPGGKLIPTAFKTADRRQNNTGILLDANKQYTIYKQHTNYILTAY